MSLAKKHVLGFSPNGGQFFALVDEQGVLRVWDTEANKLKQEFTPNLHISGACTALTWVSVGVPPPPRAKKSRRSQNESVVSSNQLYLALGTVKGNVALYSLAEGQIERTLSGDNHEGPVTSIAYNQSKGHLYTVGADFRALVWSIAEERCVADWQVGPEKPQNIVYLAKNRSLAVGARQLKVFDVETKELVETFTGHSSDINAMTSIADNDVEYILTTARMERVISFWKVDKCGKNKASACTLLMEDLAYCLVSEICTEDGSLRVASVTRNGNIHIYLLNVDGLSSEKYIKPKVSLQIASDGAETVEPLHAVSAYFVQDKNRTHEILFGYGSRRLLQFERFTPNYSEKLNVIVRADPRKLYVKKQRKEEPITGLKTEIPRADVKKVEYNSALPISKKKIQNEVPMEARLQHLQLHAAKPNGNKLQTQSKTQLLMQALHSKDQTMIQAVLGTLDTEIIQLTLKRLPLEYVNPLVNELSVLLQGKHANVACGLRWLRVLTSTHTSVLISEDKDALRDKLGICLGIAEQRMRCLTEALQISGRVNLIISQMKRNADNHLNENGVLIVNEYQDEAHETHLDDNNWSDLEADENVSNLKDIVDGDQDNDNNNVDMTADDDDVAADELDIVMTQDSDNDDGDSSDPTDSSREE